LFKGVGVTGLAALGRKSGRGKKIVRKSIEIYTTNKIMEKYPTIAVLYGLWELEWAW